MDRTRESVVKMKSLDFQKWIILYSTFLRDKIKFIMSKPFLRSDTTIETSLKKE
jgi:hypothetical protein